MAQYDQVAIRSKLFGGYISLNGTGLTCYRLEPYRGTVRTTEHVKSWETFNVHHNDDGTISFESSAFPDVYLSLDGSDVTPGVLYGDGGGSVASQVGIKAWEKFRIGRQDCATPTVTVESAAFPGRYLRTSGPICFPNVQGVPESFEEFEVLVVGHTGSASYNINIANIGESESDYRLSRSFRLNRTRSK